MFRVMILLLFVVGALARSIDLTKNDVKIKIIGGHDAEEGSAPYQVSLQTNNGTNHHCGGAIIHQRFILTASHCVKRFMPKDVTVLVGTNQLSAGKIFYKVDKLIMHSRYNTPEYANDIALVKLSENITFTDKVKLIDFEWREVPLNTSLRLTGWGQVSNYNSSSVDRLQEIELRTIGYKECKEILKDGKSVDFGNLCTLNGKGEGECHGDSGGPLTYDGKVVAVVSWGRICGSGYPDVNARVAFYHDWIRTTIANNL